MKAIGASQAPKFGVEDVYERRCVISIDGEDVKKAIKEIYTREFGGTSMARSRMGPGPGLSLQGICYYPHIRLDPRSRTGRALFTKILAQNQLGNVAVCGYDGVSTT
jgi:hypothetical protein